MTKKDVMTPYVLVVEDEEAISMMIEYNLTKEGFEVQVVENGQDAMYALEERMPDIMILDWMIPELSGVEVCKRVRAKDTTRGLPIIMLTARGEESDRLIGLESGADDYMVKPFSPKELTARIRAVLRRTRPIFEEQVLEHEGICIDLSKHKVQYNGQDVHLGPTEFRLLCYLMEHKGRVFSREQLLDAVWGMDSYLETRTVDVHIRRVRKALSDVEPALEELIKTKRGAGYILE